MDCHCLLLALCVLLHPRPGYFQGSVHGAACQLSETTVNGVHVCKASLVFEDNFDGEIDDGKWTREHMIADSPDYEFVVYDKKGRNSFVKDGILHLRPSVMDSNPSYFLRGKLDLRGDGCTGHTDRECVLEASAFDVLPPVVSARLHTAPAFTFKYGVVEVRAQLPDGNWLYPQLWLQPASLYYGPQPASGLMWVAMSRGNQELVTAAGEDVGSRLLMAGVILSEEPALRYVGVGTTSLEAAAAPFGGWNGDFHNYTLSWLQDGITAAVDGEEYVRLQPHPFSGFRSFVDNPGWANGSLMAPFDKEFYVTLGVGVGGIRDFPDNSTTGGLKKPWKNLGAKAKSDFLKDRKNWEPSWAWEDSGLRVDYVKVWAL